MSAGSRPGTVVAQAFEQQPAGLGYLGVLAAEVEPLTSTNSAARQMSRGQSGGKPADMGLSGMNAGGGERIRTPVPASREAVFKTAALNHSATPPAIRNVCSPGCGHLSRTSGDARDTGGSTGRCAQPRSGIPALAAPLGRVALYHPSLSRSSMSATIAAVQEAVPQRLLRRNGLLEEPAETLMTVGVRAT